MNMHWSAMSFEERYTYLHDCRKHFCATEQIAPDQAHRIIELDGTKILDVSSFYIHLGEQIHGTLGYFGACLDSLSDCFCGGFGLRDPIQIVWHHASHAQTHLSAIYWELQTALRFKNISKEFTTEDMVDLGYLGDGSHSDIQTWTAYYAQFFEQPLESITPHHNSSYFDEICNVLSRYTQLTLT